MRGKGPIQGIPPASETNMGQVEIATNAEVVAKTATNKVLVCSNIDSLLEALGIGDAFLYKGVINCSGNPNYPAADAGHVYKVSVAGKIGGASGVTVEIGDTAFCSTDGTTSGDHATVGANWNVIQFNIDLANIVITGGTMNNVLQGNVKFDHNVETLNDNKTLTITDKVIQKLDPNGTDRNILLPAEEDSTDLVFFIHNMGGEVGEELFIQNDAGGALTTVHYHQIAFCTCDGTTWTARAIAEEAGTDIVSIRVKEGNSGVIVTGQPVYISGAAGVAVPLVLLADCDDAAKVECVGLMAEDIARNGAGYARAHGWLGGIDSSKGGVVNPDSEDWAAGDPLYVSRTTGGLTNVSPTSGRIIEIGIALTVEGSNSKILVHVHTTPVKITTASGEDIIQRMGDSAGANKISYRDYANNEVAKMNSKGLLSVGVKEIVKASSSVLTAIEVKGTQISNYGQGASDNLQELPTAAEGMSFRVMCGTAQGANYFRFQADSSDKIYWNGTPGNDNGYITIVAPTVGAWFDIFTFKTGAATWDWWAEIGFGNWAAGGP